VFGQPFVLPAETGIHAFFNPAHGGTGFPPEGMTGQQFFENRNLDKTDLRIAL
jgi:hypothetical protein